MGCLQALPQDTPNTTNRNDQERLITDPSAQSKYEFHAEYILNKSDLKDEKIISRRPSVSLSVAHIDFLRSIQPESNMADIKEESNDDEKTNAQNILLKKYLKTDEWNGLLFRREAKILSTLSHANCVSYISSYQDDRAYYLVLEYCCNGSLIDYINQQHERDASWYTERVIVDIIHSLVSVAACIHKMNIVHRNICIESIMISNQGTYKLIAWDDAEIVENRNDVYDDFVGNNIYCLPPESLQIRHGWQLKKMDMFAIGAVAFLLCFGCVPFSGQHLSHICRNIKLQQCNWPQNSTDFVSTEMRQFVKTTLAPNAYAQISAADAVRSPLLSGKQASMAGHYLLYTVPYKLYCYAIWMKIRKLLIKNEHKEEWDADQRSEMIDALQKMYNVTADEINETHLQRLLQGMGYDKIDIHKRSKILFGKLILTSTQQIKTEQTRKQSKKLRKLNPITKVSSRSESRQQSDHHFHQHHGNYVYSLTCNDNRDEEANSLSELE